MAAVASVKRRGHWRLSLGQDGILNLRRRHCYRLPAPRAENRKRLGGQPVRLEAQCHRALWTSGCHSSSSFLLSQARTRRGGGALTTLLPVRVYSCSLPFLSMSSDDPNPDSLSSRFDGLVANETPSS